MNKKLKFLSKTIIISPQFILLYLALFGINDIKWFNAVAFALIISSFIMFYNCFDYEKFDQMDSKDFLESTHSTSISKEDLLSINQLASKLKIKYNVKEISAKSIEIQVNDGVNNSVIFLNIIDDLILIKIKRKYFSFFPDNAKNYKMLQEFIKENKSYS